MFEIKPGSPPSKGGPHATRYPTPQLEVGTYFEVKAEDARHLKFGLQAVRGTCLTWGRNNNRKIVTRMQPSGSLRVYRVE